MYSNLRAHPKVVLPPLKELRYFWENTAFADDKVIQRLISRKQYRDYFRRCLKRYFRNPARLVMDSKRSTWDFRYLFTEHDDAWYLRCFESEEGLVCGEISPQYFFLKDDAIRHIHELVPEVRIIISLRQPADWFGSLLRMHAPQCVRDHDGQAFEALLSRYSATCSFSQALQRWRGHFSADRLLVVFYDELCSSPWHFYSRICRFLGIEPDPARLPRLAQKVNEGNALKIPDDFAQRIEAAWREDIRELAVLLPCTPKGWKNPGS